MVYRDIDAHKEISFARGNVKVELRYRAFNKMFPSFCCSCVLYRPPKNVQITQELYIAPLAREVRFVVQHDLALNLFILLGRLDRGESTETPVRYLTMFNFHFIKLTKGTAVL